jgi:RimJ/RimL family protein N-acetyltransferase
MNTSISIIFKEVETQEERILLRGIAEPVWRSCYAEIISQEQMSYMLDWMYSIETIEKEQSEGIKFFIINSTDSNSPIGLISIDSIPNPITGGVELHKLYTSQSYWGKGIGQKALNFATELAVNAKAKFIELRVNKCNTRAVNAYLKNGFCKHREDCLDIGNGFVMDDYIMRKNI